MGLLVSHYFYGTSCFLDSGEDVQTINNDQMWIPLWNATQEQETVWKASIMLLIFQVIGDHCKETWWDEKNTWIKILNWKSESAALSVRLTFSLIENISLTLKWLTFVLFDSKWKLKPIHLPVTKCMFPIKAHTDVLQWHHLKGGDFFSLFNETAAPLNDSQKCWTEVTRYNSEKEI